MKTKVYKVATRHTGGLQHTTMTSPEPLTCTPLPRDPVSTPDVTSRVISEEEEEERKTVRMFELLERMQSARLNDQRCSFPASQPSTPTTPKHAAPASLQLMLRHPGPYPMVVLPVTEGYWVDGLSPLTDEQLSARVPVTPATGTLDTDDTALLYRKYFYGKSHETYLGQDEQLGSLLMSVRYEDTAHGEKELVRVMLRTKSGTVHSVQPGSLDSDVWLPYLLAKAVKPEVTTDKFLPVLYPKASNKILQFDEHTVNAMHKFGVILQKHGQTSEEQLFSNMDGSPEYREFLNLLGTRVQLHGYQGYRGGLDTRHNQTGLESVAAHLGQHDIMFHVSTFLPHDPADLQQLQRKRHIGNDMVAVVLQEDNTPFSPAMVASHFLHAFIIIQPIPGDKYRVCVTARSDVPEFGPPLPDPPVFSRGREFIKWLLTKLINAENACYKAQRFDELRQRTRVELLKALHSELLAKSAQLMPTSFDAKTDGNVLSTVKRAITIWKNATNGHKGKVKLADIIGTSPLSPRLKRKKVKDKEEVSSVGGGPPEQGGGGREWSAPGTPESGPRRPARVSASSSFASLDEMVSSPNTSQDQESDIGNDSLCSASFGKSPSPEGSVMWHMTSLSNSGGTTGCNRLHSSSTMASDDTTGSYTTATVEELQAALQKVEAEKASLIQHLMEAQRHALQQPRPSSPSHIEISESSITI